jgi:amino acid permease
VLKVYSTMAQRTGSSLNIMRPMFDFLSILNHSQELKERNIDKMAITAYIGFELFLQSGESLTPQAPDLVV